MGDIGYQNRQEEGTGMKACYDSLDAYIRSLTWAIETPCPQYEKIGVKVGERWEQLNDHVLQIENEYYSTVRPKQLTDWMERPTLALRRRGVRYVELRSLDVNAFHPLGIDEEQMRLPAPVHALLPARREPAHRRPRASRHRRQPGPGRAPRPRARSSPAVRSTARRPCATGHADAGRHGSRWPSVLDADGDLGCVSALDAQRRKFADPEATPSARMLARCASG
jgi:glutamate--cysteine ligase